MNIILGVTGSIAAYRAADIANSLTKDGHSVFVVMTRGGMEFITPLTFESLTGNRVCTDLFERNVPHEIEHISLAKKADLLLVAPASADSIGKLANGIADDMLSTVALAIGDIPKLIAPAMNTRMYESAPIQANLRRLKEYGYEIIEPRAARLACGDLGRGALAEVPVIVREAESRLEGRKSGGSR